MREEGHSVELGPLSEEGEEEWAGVTEIVCSALSFSECSIRVFVRGLNAISGSCYVA